MTETIFAWPGLGRYAYQSAVSNDFPSIMGVTFVIALMYIFVNLVVDLLYARARPADPLRVGTSVATDERQPSRSSSDFGCGAGARHSQERARPGRSCCATAWPCSARRLCWPGCCWQLLAPLIAPYDPIDQDVRERLQGPSAAHLLGRGRARPRRLQSRPVRRPRVAAGGVRRRAAGERIRHAVRRPGRRSPANGSTMRPCAWSTWCWRFRR